MLRIIATLGTVCFEYSSFYRIHRTLLYRSVVCPSLLPLYNSGNPRSYRMSTTYNLSDINCSPAKCSSCWMRFYVAILVLPGRVVEIWTWAGFKVAVGFILTVLHSHCDRINIILKQTNLRRLWNLILPVTLFHLTLHDSQPAAVYTLNILWMATFNTIVSE